MMMQWLYRLVEWEEETKMTGNILVKFVLSVIAYAIVVSVVMIIGGVIV